MIRFQFTGHYWSAVVVSYGHKLEASSQLAYAPEGMLECWNTGIMGTGILQGWVNGPPKAEQ